MLALIGKSNRWSRRMFSLDSVTKRSLMTTQKLVSIGRVQCGSHCAVKSSTDKARSLRSNPWIWQSPNGLEKQTYKQAPLPWHLERQGFKNFEYELRKNNSMEAREGKSCFYDGITLYVLIAWWERDRKWEPEDTRPMEEVSEWNGRKHNLKGGGPGLGEETSFSQKPRASWEQIKVFGSGK